MSTHHDFSDRQLHGGKPANPRPGTELSGRTAELELVDSLLARRHPSRPGLLLRGAPGVGKTALLDTAAARAADIGMRVLRASGVEFEAEMDFSALHQLLYPVRRHADRLGDHHRDVLDRIFGLAPGPPPEPLAASTAVLALLGEVIVERPLLMIADDVPWIDHASATALRFVVRRIGDDPIVFLAAMRTGADHLATNSIWSCTRSGRWTRRRQPSCWTLDGRGWGRRCGGGCWQRPRATRSRCGNCRRC